MLEPGFGSAWLREKERVTDMAKNVETLCGEVSNGKKPKEGGLGAPLRQPIPWKEEEYHNEQSCLQELERVFNICHGCRRCVSLCNAYPTLFDLVDSSSTFEVDGVKKSDYAKVVNECYLCDLCFMTKCPYVPPHEWNVDFPHLMLRAKAIQFKQGKTRLRDRMLSSSDMIGNILGIPVVSSVVNAVNASSVIRKVTAPVTGIHPKAKLPELTNHAWQKTRSRTHASLARPVATDRTRGRVAIFATCYIDKKQPRMGDDLVFSLEKNNIETRLITDSRCCGMPKLEIGDLDSVAKLCEYNIALLSSLVKEGWDLMSIIPSCVLMFKQELPLLFPKDENVCLVKEAFFDPFEYLMLRHREKLLNTDFKKPLGKIVYHASCHQRVQNIGQKTRELFSLIPGTTVQVVERCSGHNGTYGYRAETYEMADKLCRPVRKVMQQPFDHYISDCPMAAAHIANSNDISHAVQDPFHLLRLSYEAQR